uniref:Phosphatidylinositol-specific phospholipase C, X domain containing 3 n=1 Tax=Neogobius melanostomus TaxID=47308 RepID=A0A8C6TSZ2_9GOBI
MILILIERAYVFFFIHFSNTIDFLPHLFLMTYLLHVFTHKVNTRMTTFHLSNISKCYFYLSYWQPLPPLRVIGLVFDHFTSPPPGSHDSFSFYIDESSPVGPEQPETVQNFVSVFGTVAKKLMRKWLATQTMNFTSQLESGIRFFDLRISTKPRDPDNELFFAHGLFSATVREGLEQISSFLSAHAREVVFLDFNHFYGVQNHHHEKLVAMLKEIFGDKLCPVVFAQEVSLQYLWEKEYQVLVFYHHPMALEVPFLWPGQMMPSPWANTTDPEKLIQFLQTSVTDRRKKGSFFVSQVVLTPKASTVMKGVASGLRETITERALPAMMQWIRSQRPGESGINIITADFVELGEFISAVITLNYHLDEEDEDAT